MGHISLKNSLSILVLVVFSHIRMEKSQENGQGILETGREEESVEWATGPLTVQRNRRASQ